MALVDNSILTTKAKKEAEEDGSTEDDSPTDSLSPIAPEAPTPEAEVIFTKIIKEWFWKKIRNILGNKY